jgi:predicted RNase H-like nuclease (RuvC/YqgF family)
MIYRVDIFSGVQLVLGDIEGADLVKVTEDHHLLSLELKLQRDEVCRVSNALQIVQEAIEENKKEMDKKLEFTNQRVDQLRDDRTEDCRRIDCLDKRVEALESTSEPK